jgi:hypothetical protein
VKDLTHIPPPDIRPPDPEQSTRPKGREIPNHQSRSGVTVGGWGAILFGSPFLAVGVVVILIAAGVIPVY